MSAAWTRPTMAALLLLLGPSNPQARQNAEVLESDREGNYEIYP